MHIYSEDDYNQIRAAVSSTVPITTVSVVIYGFSKGWVAGAPLVPKAISEFIIEPLMRDLVSFDVFICIEQSGENSQIFQEFITFWHNLNVTLFIFDDTKSGRRQHCYERALANRASVGLTAPDFWVAMRTDLLLFSPLPRFASMPRYAISARARMAHLYSGLSTNHFSWLFDNNLCVDFCKQPCDVFTRRYFMADDQIGIVPNAFASIYFGGANHTIQDLETLADTPVCTIFTRVDSTSLRYRYFPEHFALTCPLMVAGVSFEPLEIIGRLNPYSRNDFWAPLQIPFVPPIPKSCY